MAQTPEEAEQLVHTWADAHNAQWMQVRHALYLHTKNPVHAWRAYAAARKLGIAIPDWVLSLFDEWATTLTEVQHPSAKAIADALGLGGRGGPTVTRLASIQERQLEIVERILRIKDQSDGRSQLDIFTQVEEEFGVSVDRITAIFAEFTRPNAEEAK